MTDFRYQIKRSGAKVVADFERLLRTSDVAKITPGLYHALIQHGGFIAHYNIGGFRGTFNGRLTELLAGEFYRLDDPGRWAPERMRHLEDSGYTDGLSAGDVMRQIAAIGARYADEVRSRESTQRQANEIATAAALAARHGLKVVPS